MSKTLIGMVTYGNLEFTKLTVQEIKRTVQKPYNLFAIVGKPGDIETEQYFRLNNIHYISHVENWGFPYSINDIYDYAWKKGDFDNIVFIGNDVIPYPHAIDSLMEVADNTDFEWICAREYSVKALLSDFPDAKEFFAGDNLVFNFDGEPWKLAKPKTDEIIINGAGLSDTHNLSLYKKSVFEKIGYIDVNFYPAYYEDNDYARRAVNAKIKSCTLVNSIYFHFWSRTIHQGPKGASDHSYFDNNKLFYTNKWAGDFGKERWSLPFNGAKRYVLGEKLFLNQGINIQDRSYEKDAIDYWRQLHVNR